MSKIYKVYGRSDCIYCLKVIELFQLYNLTYEYQHKATGRVPVVFVYEIGRSPLSSTDVNGALIGGYNELVTYTDFMESEF